MKEHPESPPDIPLGLVARTLSIASFLTLALAVPIIMLSLTLVDGLSCSTL